MSDMVTHWGAFEDCRRLAQLDEQLPQIFREVVEAKRDVGRLGTLTRLSKIWMQPILTAAKKQLNTADDDKARRNIAFVMGGLIHASTDNTMKPVLSDMSGANWTQMQASLRGTPGVAPVSEEGRERAHEFSAYLDAEVFRQVYLDGEAEGLNQLFMGKITNKGRELEDTIRALFQRSLLSAHTLNPTADNMDNMYDWLDNLFSLVQPFFVDVDRWVRVYQNPDPKKIEEFGVRTKFYRPEDPHIRAARAIQHGKPVDAATRKAVYEDCKYDCIYGKILQVGLSYYRAAGVFWRGESENLMTPGGMGR